MPKVTFVKKAQKDYPDHNIVKGESYYWWKFRFGGKHFSKTYPKQSQLTQSNFLSQVYEIQERISAYEPFDVDDLETFRDELVSDLQNLQEECQSSLDNMPEQLQSAPTGELLQERIDNLDSVISELESLDPSFDGDEDDEDYEENKQTFIDDFVGELQGIDFSF